MANIRDELKTVNERLNKLEGKPNEKQVTFQSDIINENKGKNLNYQMTNPTNNKGIANAHERARKDTQRKFE